VTLELVVKRCEKFKDSTSLSNIRFLAILLLGYAGFLRVGELHSIQMKDIRRSDMSVTVSERKKINTEKDTAYKFPSQESLLVPSKLPTKRLLTSLDGSNPSAQFLHRFFLASPTFPFCASVLL